MYNVCFEFAIKSKLFFHLSISNFWLSLRDVIENNTMEISIARVNIHKIGIWWNRICSSITTTQFLGWFFIKHGLYSFRHILWRIWLVSNYGRPGLPVELMIDSCFTVCGSNFYFIWICLMYSFCFHRFGQLKCVYLLSSPPSISIRRNFSPISLFHLNDVNNIANKTTTVISKQIPIKIFFWK